MIDDWHYFVFPGVVLNLHSTGFLLFRARPDLHDPGSCWFDVYRFELPSADAEEAAPVRNVIVADTGTSFGRVLDQDFKNLPKVQRGLAGGALEFVTLSGQEVRVLALHDAVDRYLADPLTSV